MKQKDVIFIKINRLFREDITSEELYEATRGIWKVNANKVKTIKYAFAIYKGIIKEVYHIETWHDPLSTTYHTREIDKDDPKHKGRKEFTGKVALNIRDCFIEKSIAKYYKHGEANPIKYMSFEELQKDLCNENLTSLIYPDEIQDENLFEGTKKQVLVNAYERNPEARKQCIKKYGYDCSVCGFNFEKIYGVLGENFIHVHHLVQISDIGQEYEINPIEDLRPVCPNCHAMLHKKNPPYSINELKDITKYRSK